MASDFSSLSDDDLLSSLTPRRAAAKAPSASAAAPDYATLSDDDLLAGLPARKGQGGGVVKNLGMGALRGAKDVIDTGAQWLASGFDKIAGTKEGEQVKTMNEAGKADFEKGYGGSTAASIGRVGGQIAATLPVGGVLGAGATAAGAGGLGAAIASGGLRAGQAGLATRALGGAIQGGASAGFANPEDAGTGAAIGSAVPLAVRALGQVGKAVGGIARPFYGAGQDKIVGNALREFAADPDAARAALANSKELIPGSLPTTAMAAGDTGLAGLGRALTTSNPAYVADLAARQTLQNQARTAALEGVAGNPGKMSLAKKARDDLTGSMRDDVLKRAGDVPAEGLLTQLDGMLANPDNAGQLAQQALGQFRARIGGLAGPDGTVNARALYAIRKDVNDVLGGKLQGEAGNLRYASGQLTGVKGLIDDAIDSASRRTTLPSSTALGPLSQRVGPQAGTTAGSAQPSWRQYLETYTNESKPIDQMKELSKVLQKVQTGTVDAQGNAILSPAVLNNLLKNQGDDLARVLTPDQLDLLRRLQADLNAGQLANNAGRAVGSNTAQNLASDGLLQSLAGRALANSPLAGQTVGRVSNWIYKGANEQIQQKLAEAMLDPARAATLMQPKGPLSRSLAAAPLSLAARAAPVALTGPDR